MAEASQPVPASPSNRGWLTWVVALLLAAVTLVAFWGVRKAQFIEFDDLDYVLNNPPVRAGLTAGTVQWAFIGVRLGNWHPLTWLSHAADCQFFGVDPGAHHLTNLGFHLVNTVLLFVVLQGLTGARWRSAFVAALFALHPLHVESVAWVAERKDLLSTFFFLLTLLAYGQYARRRGAGAEGKEPGARSAENEAKRPDLSSEVAGPWFYYLLALLAYACGLMSKPMLVTTPCVLLLLDYWPLRRIPTLAGAGTWPALRPLLVEKLPLFALSAASCLATVLAQQTAHAFAAGNSLSLETRLANGLLAAWTYLAKAVWPARLAIFYPYSAHLPPGQLLLGLAVIGGLTALVLAWHQRFRFLFTGWFWYLGMLVPVSGIVQVGEQSMADRYTYLPLIGIFIGVVWGGAAWAGASVSRRLFLTSVGLVCLAAFGLQTTRQVAFWKDNESLFTHAIEVTEGNYLAHLIVGDALAADGHGPAAVAHYDQALAIFPEFAEAYSGKGRVAQDAGRLDEAVQWYRRALGIAPDYPESNFSLGLALLALKHPAEAIPCLEKARRSPARFAQATAALTLAKAQIGHWSEAEAALKELPESDRLTPQCQLLGAIIRAGQGQPDAAFEVFTHAQPVPAGAKSLLEELAQVLGQQRRNDLVARVYAAILELTPDDVATLNNLAWVLATDPNAAVRDGPRAVRLAQRACDLTGGKVAFLLGTLAAAQAEATNFTAAVLTAEKAQSLATEAGQKETAEINGKLLELYRAGRPYRNAVAP